ncbi:hypothetical protein K4A76_06905 [Pseudomonas sp. NEEL19]|uniref:hypothetical protein n=1 Tax=Pseudomonas sp. NEEL19 TaxID=2867409 RepID=UPI00236885E9|nr:hypothetical protein [Pseudomonas sp. NEEL19]WDM60661.1 hypothetical protein K4A76_06905 [Pseudomonas sp. NEEL19]
MRDQQWDNAIVISILKNAEDTLQAASYGLDDVKAKDGPRKLSGIRNLVVFGRSVTFVLQNLRGKVEGFDEWYAPHQEAMSQDKVMRYFLELRNTILKVGELRTMVEATLNGSTEDLLKSATKPPGAKGMFVGDVYGGSGWYIPMSDGSIEKFYVDLPKDLADVKSYFLSVPENYREAIDSRDVVDLGEEYLHKLKVLIDDCPNIFIGQAAQTYGPDKKRLPRFMRIIK